MPCLNPKAASTSGFTLIEVLLAAVILTTGIAIVFRGFSTGLRAASFAEKETIAALLAQTLITNVESEETLSVGTEEGDFEDQYEGEYPGYRWRIEVDESEDETTSGLYEVKITVFWPNGENEREITITRLVAPSYSGYDAL